MDDDFRWFRRRVLAWGERNRRAFPWRTARDPFRILVAEVLLQRTRADTVAPVYRELFRRWPSARRLAAADVRSIARVIRPLGLAYRARRLKELACAVVEARGVPSDAPEMLELPGVGRYVANATAAVAFGTRVPTVDGVSARVYRRFFGLDSEVPAVGDTHLWEIVGQVTPRARVREWNWAVLDLAAAVCTPRAPRCSICPLKARCQDMSQSG